jgi:hypothetical protein
VLIVAWMTAAGVSAVTIHAHAMWFDELQAWNIARASHSLPDLLAHLRYEGHPALWYLLLYGLTRFTGDPRALQVFGWLIAVATYAVVLFRAPFPVPARVALVAGYFFAFEYSVIVRSYGLGLLLLVLALSWLAAARPAWGKAGVALALLAWTSLAGALLAVALASVVAWRWWSTTRDRGECRAPFSLAAVVVGSAGVAALTCIPPSDFHSFSLGIPNSSSAYADPQRIAAAVGGPWRGLVPIPLGVGQWNTNLIDQFPAAVWVQALVSLALVVLVARALRPCVTAWTLWIVGIGAYVAFSVVVVLPDRAHYAGEFFLLFLACAWLAYAPPGRGRSASVGVPRALAAILVFVVAAQVVTAVAILPDATARPFAPDRTLARAASRAGLAGDVVSGQDFDGVTMSGYLDRDVYSIARGAPIRYFVNDEREARGNVGLTPDALVCAAAEVARARGRPVALVVDKPLPTPSGVAVLAAAQGVRLYRIAPDAALSATCHARLGDA